MEKLLKTLIGLNYNKLEARKNLNCKVFIQKKLSAKIYAVRLN
jgi:hypothetical protein